MDVAAVVFDLDGVLIDSEQIWDDVRREVATERSGQWRDGATTAMQGMSTPEWATYLVTELGTCGRPDEVASVVIERMTQRYRQRLPLLAGAVPAVRAIGACWPLAVASSSPPELIRTVLETAGVADLFPVRVSSEEVLRGKPAPDVYLAAAQRLGVDPAAVVAIEDSANGLRSAAAAGMTVVAVPNPHYPPPDHVLALAVATVPNPAALTPELIGRLPGRRAIS